MILKSTKRQKQKPFDFKKCHITKTNTPRCTVEQIAHISGIKGYSHELLSVA